MFMKPQHKLVYYLLYIYCIQTISWVVGILAKKIL